MQTSTLVVVGAHSQRGMQWLAERLPFASRRGRALLLRLPGGELDTVLWAEELRLEARRADVRLSLGIAELDGATPEHAGAAAARAYQHAFRLGGDITLAASNLLRAA